MILLKDLRFGLRALTAKPSYLAIVLLTLAIGIGLTTTMFSLVNSILLKPLPLPQSEQLVQLGFETSTRRDDSASFRVYELLRDADTPLKGVTFAAFDQGVLSQGEKHTPLTMLISSYDYLSVLQVKPILGRWYNESDVGKNMAVMSYDTWATYFSRAPDIVGKSILLNKLAYTVIGVMPAGFRDIGTNTPDLWTPIAGLRRPGLMYARLGDGLSLEQAKLQVETINRVIRRESDPNSGDWSITFTSLKERSVREVRPPLLLLSLAVSAVFLIALLNVINLTLVYYMNRVHELAVRVAVGASRKRLVRQLLTESFLLAILGGGLGVLVTAWGLEAIKVLAEGRIPRLHEVGLDLTTMAVTFALVLIATMGTALLPALQLLKPEQLGLSLRESGGKSTASKSGQMTRQVLVAAEVTLAVVLLIGAGLMLRSYTKLMAVDPGFTTQNRVAGHVWLPNSFSTKTSQLNHWRELLQRVAEIPQVRSVAGTSSLPTGRLGIDYDINYSFDEAPDLGEQGATRGSTRAVSTDYFKTLEIPLLEGRVFDERDDENASKVVIINRALAATLWQDVSPIGRTLLLPDWSGGPRTIVGVVDDVKHRGLRANTKPEFFTPMSQQVYPGMSLVAEVLPGSQTKVLLEMARVATDLDVAAPFIIPARMEELASSTVGEERLLLQIISVFSALSLLMASIGVYGISANMVSQRIKEIGVRMALGASPKGIRRWVVTSALKPVLSGALAGIVLALLLVEVISSYLYDVWMLDPAVYVTVPGMLVLVAVIATWWPAQSATSVNPQQALKHD